MNNNHFSARENRFVFFAGETLPKPEVEKPFPEDVNDDLIRKERSNLQHRLGYTDDSIAEMKRGGGYKEGTVMYDAEVAFGLFLEGKNAEALSKLNAVISKEPNYFIARLKRSMVLRFLGKNNEALIDSTFMIQNSKVDSPEVEQRNHYATGCTERAKSYRAQGKFKDAIDSLEDALKALPKYRDALRELHDIYTTCPNRALRNSERARVLKEIIDEQDAAEKTKKSDKQPTNEEQPTKPSPLPGKYIA